MESLNEALGYIRKLELTIDIEEDDAERSENLVSLCQAARFCIEEAKRQLFVRS